ncbi:hypothetical protein KFL_009890020 [Klebsormidium nitens]|uniref:Uncharacterized protein n=1 Tax=Klebsormidium nitens TaxID=105231 RepID=A0A1Y1IN80_KLENI|nr:hypothetical protein KFL_009890020 [Klebsormidium nitens]|eukprot:GAQ92350.1 hypothetical protein KFL_009890020 [Klebsormidium nitens]
MLAKQDKSDSKNKVGCDPETISLIDLDDTFSGTQLAALFKRGLQQMDLGLAAAPPLSKRVKDLLEERDKVAGKLLALLKAIDSEVSPAGEDATNRGSARTSPRPEEDEDGVTFRAQEGLPGDVSGAKLGEGEEGDEGEGGEEGDEGEEGEEGDEGDGEGPQGGDAKASEAMDEDTVKEEEQTRGEAMVENFKEHIKLNYDDEKMVNEEPNKDEVETPRDTSAAAAPAEVGDSPGSSYGPSHRHEDDSRGLLPPRSTMDLGTYVHVTKLHDDFLKNVKECKGDDTVAEWRSGKGNVSQVVFYTTEYAKYNVENGRYGSIYGQGYNVKKWVGAENVPMAVIKIGQNGKLEVGAVDAANEQIKEWWAATNPGKAFDDSLLTSAAQLEKLIEIAEKKLKNECGLPPNKAKLPAGSYELGQFYYMQNCHDFLTLPLEHAPGLSTYAYLEAELLISLGQRAASWSKKDFQKRIMNDLNRRISRQRKILDQGNRAVMKKHWQAHGDAADYDELVVRLV